MKNLCGAFVAFGSNFMIFYPMLIYVNTSVVQTLNLSHHFLVLRLRPPSQSSHFFSLAFHISPRLEARRSLHTTPSIMRTCVSATALLLTLSSSLVSAQSFYSGVIATGTQGATNPPQATLGTAINQTSMARLLSINSVDVSLSILLEITSLRSYS